MRLLFKSILSVGILGVATGATIGISYAVNQKNSGAKEFSYQSNLTKFTNIAEDVNNFKALVVKRGGDIKKDKIADVSIKDKKVNGENIDDFYNKIAQKHGGLSPDLVIKVGSITFNNYYTNAVKPSEFIDFVRWFFKNVSWGPEISTLNTFSIVRGVERSSSSITLGGHSSSAHESTNIQFYPDAFFGSLPMYSMYSGPGMAGDSLVGPFGGPSKIKDIESVMKNVVPIYDEMMKKDVKSKLGKVLNSSNVNGYKTDGITVKKSDIERAHYEFTEHLYKTGNKIEDGKKIQLYTAYTQNNPELFKAILKKYPYHLKETVGPTLQKDGKGKWKVVVKKHKYMPFSERIPMPEVLSLNPEFKGIGTSWLKYVSAHEYGHHQTLQDATDNSEGKVMMGSWNLMNGPTFDGRGFDPKYVNMYLKARAKGMKVIPVSSAETSSNIRDSKNYKKGIYAKFSIDNGKTFETNKQIFGTEREDVFAFNKPTLSPEWKAYMTKRFKWALDYMKTTMHAMLNYRFTSLDKILKYQPKLIEDMDLAITLAGIEHPDLVPWDIGIEPDVPKYFHKNPTIRGLATKESMEKIYKGKTYKGYLLNAFDNNSGTLSEGFTGDSQVMSNGKFVDPFDINRAQDLTDEEDRADEALLDASEGYKVTGWETFDGDKDSTIKDIARTLKSKSKFLVEDPSNIFTDYTMSLPEVLTRDMVQITYRPDTSPLMPGFKKRKNPDENISEASTGYDYFVSKEMNKKWIRNRQVMKGNLDVVHKVQFNELFWRQYSKTDEYSINSLMNGTKLTKEQKESLNNVAVSAYGSKYLTFADAYGDISETYLGKNLSMRNGYFNDRFLRKEINWNIYNDDGSQAPYDGEMTDLQNKKIQGVADAYWYFLLKSKGIGDRTISGIWRSKARDAAFAFGYIDIPKAQIIKYLAIKNKETNHVEYIPIHINQDNMHYYKSQKSNKIKTLREEGYTSWTTDYFSVGSYKDAVAKPGLYNIYFVDSGKNHVDGLTIGSRKIITENGKLGLEAPLNIKKDQKGLVMTVFNQFAK